MQNWTEVLATDNAVVALGRLVTKNNLSYDGFLLSLIFAGDYIRIHQILRDARHVNQDVVSLLVNSVARETLRVQQVVPEVVVIQAHPLALANAVLMGFTYAIYAPLAFLPYTHRHFWIHGHDKEDVFHDVFTKVWNDYHPYRNTSFKTLLSKAYSNRVKDLLRIDVQHAKYVRNQLVVCGESVDPSKPFDAKQEVDNYVEELKCAGCTKPEIECYIRYMDGGETYSETADALMWLTDEGRSDSRQVKHAVAKVGRALQEIKVKIDQSQRKGR